MERGFPEDVILGIYYNISAYDGLKVNGIYREEIIQGITESVSKSTSPRKNYDMALSELQNAVENIFDKHVEVVE